MAFELPRVAVLQPVVRGLFLATINNVLLEHTVVVADAVAAPWQAKRSQRVEEAGGQTPQATVAEAGVVLFVDQLFKIQPHLFQRVFNVAVDAQCQQGIREGAANQKLHRQVIDLARLLRELRTV